MAPAWAAISTRPTYNQTHGMINSHGFAMALCAASLMLTGASAALAQENAAEPQKRQIENVEQQIQGSKAEQERIAAEIAAALREQEEVAARLIEISRVIQSREAAINDSEAELLRLGEEQVLLLADLGEKQDILSELLAGLQRLEQNPPPALVVEPHDVLAALRGAMLLGTVVPELRAEADQLSRQLARLETLRSSIKARKQVMTEDIARLTTASRELDTLIIQKKELVRRGNANLDAEQKRSLELAGRAANLRQLMADLAAERAKAEADRLKKAEAAERERARQEELRRQPKMVFAEAKGRLSYPAQGRVLRRFGEPDGLGGKSQGLAVVTRDGAQVTAPADGDVEFAGSFRTYGQLVILNPGGGYRILLAGMEKVTTTAGEHLRAGEPIGQMGRGPSSVTLLGDVVHNDRPVLYIEFRNSTDAIDSDPWWIGGMKEARG